jgi:hypothetical protein
MRLIKADARASREIEVFNEGLMEDSSTNRNKWKSEIAVLFFFVRVRGPECEYKKSLKLQAFSRSFLLSNL